MATKNNNLLIQEEWIKLEQLRFVEGDSKVKDQVWKSCVHAMNQRMSKLKDEKRKQQKEDVWTG